MTTLAPSSTRPGTGVPTPRQTVAADLRRLGVLARAELALLLRNTTALVNAILMPLVLVGVFSLASAGSGALAVTVVTMVACAGMNFVVYYTLVTTLVARRQELVLKRLRTGEAPAWVILGAAAIPLVGMVVIQLGLGFAAAVAVLGLGRPTNVLLVVVAVGLGLAVWIVLAIVSSGFTKTVESAQITTLPAVVVPLLFSGLSIPLAVLPEPVQRLAHLLPLTPIVDLFRLGLTGQTADGTTVTLAASFAAAVPPVLVLVGWLVVGVLGARRVFCWDPRR